ncbi:MAG: hypothetical protein Q9183_002775 [Haloplaca sp. 2 TL-2023]
MATRQLNRSHPWDLELFHSSLLCPIDRRTQLQLIMIFKEYRALGRLSSFSSQCLNKRITPSLAFNVARVTPALQHHFAAQQATAPFNLTQISVVGCRSYATNAVSRPKAHTGRTTSAPRKKKTASKAVASASDSTSDAAAKVPKKAAAKKSTSSKTTKSKSKSKPRTKAKSTKARKKTTKAKAKPKKKAQTPEEKSRLAIKQLKITALTPPKGLPATALQVILIEVTQKGKNEATGQGQKVPALMASAATKYRSLTPEEREHYNHIANQNKAINEAKYREWIQSHTPTQIHDANNARLLLRRKSTSGKQWRKLKDERMPTGRRGAYTEFATDRYKSGDFAGMKVTEASKLIGAEWRALDASRKKPYIQKSDADGARYEQEVKAVYNRDVKHSAAKAS